MSPLKYVKVYGERCSGTGFAQKLVAANFEVEITPNVPDPTAAQKASIESMADDFVRRREIGERIVDWNHSDGLARCGGWKHACVTTARLAAIERSTDTLFLCVVRHPALWARSFFLSPFAAFAEPPADFGAFLRTPFATRPRDEASAPILASPADLWREKVESYLAAAHPNLIVLRHEDMLMEPSGPLEALATRLPRSGRKWRIPKADARPWLKRRLRVGFLSRGRDFDEIRADLPSDPWSALDPVDAEFMRSRIGDALLDATGYRNALSPLGAIARGG